MNISFEYEEMLFEGLLFKNSNKYSDKYFQDLLIEDNIFNRSKYKNAIREQFEEVIHIKMSYSFVVNVLSKFFIFISFILGIMNLLIPAIIFIGSSCIFYFLFKCLNNSIKEINVGKNLSNDLIDLIFENNK